MWKVGVTGGIGSGKTTVCRIFSSLGVPVYYADERGKDLLVSDPDVVMQVKKIFGDQAYAENGLNRKYISDQVFKDKNLLQQLNAIVHPAVFKDSMEWFQRHHDKPYTIYEAAIMFETGSNKLMDKMITVVAELEERISRTLLRDNTTREDVLERVDKQLPDAEKISQSDFVIYNNHSEEYLVEQVRKIHEQLISPSL